MQVLYDTSKVVITLTKFTYKNFSNKDVNVSFQLFNSQLLNNAFLTLCK